MQKGHSERQSPAEDVLVDEELIGHRSRFTEAAKQSLHLLSPRRLVPLMVISIFIAECGVMFLLDLLPPLSVTTEALFDSTVLLIILSPTFYLFHYRPIWLHHQDRKKIIDRLSLSEERLALALDAVNDGLCDWNIQTGEVYFSPRTLTMLGYQAGEISADIDTWQGLIHPDDRERVQRILDEHLANQTSHYVTEHRMLNNSGYWTWVLARGRVVSRDDAGRALRLVGTHTDITPRKVALEALRKSEEEIRALTQRLIYTSEEEKKHLAQDLHDEFGQVLTAFQLGVEMLRSHSYEDEKDYQFHCSRLLKLVTRLETDLRHICDQLRPIMLDDVGLVSTLRWHIKEFEMIDRSLQIDFSVDGTEQHLSRELKIALYRIVQESLNNVVKHADASRVEIVFSYLPGKVSLMIKDNGCGLAQCLKSTSKKISSSFGLLGMRERAAAVNGVLQIESTDQGMTVNVEVPLKDAGYEINQDCTRR